ncbi:MAG: hypothetical protein J5489_05485, partial [Lachnospiraceae bacterium]|nr:hypothetical protein [Lachnospiraceae bacterium]
MERKTAWEKYTRKQKTEVMTFAEGYRQFISDCKTERECVKEFVKIASNQGFKDLSKLIEKKGKLKAGDKVLKLTQDSVDAAREELQDKEREAELAYRSGVIEYERSKIV